MPCTVVVGAQWGDEGKGKIVDALSARAHMVARYQGIYDQQLRARRRA